MIAYLRPLAVGALLLGEVMALTFAFDTQRLDLVDSGWAQVVGHSPQALRLVSSIAVAVFTLIALSRPAPFRVLTLRRHPAGQFTVGAIHGVSLGIFAWVTAVIVAVGNRYLQSPALWTIAWLSSGTATITAWGLLLVPWSGWMALFAGARMSVAAGAVIGTIGWAFGFVTQEFWIPLSRYTFACVDWLLRLFYAQTVSRPTILLVGTPSFRIGITPQCSGFEGVGLLLAFMTLYLWFCRRELRFPRALVLLPLGAIVAWLANVVRIVALIAIGTAGWRGVATGGFHSQAGWVLFNVIALGFVMMAHHAPYFRRPAESISSNPLTSTGPVGERTTALLGPFIVITATAMITGLFSAGFDWLYPVRVVTVSLFLWTFRREYLTFRWSWSWWSLGLGLIAFLTWIALVPDNAAQKGSWPATLRAAPLGWAAAWLFFRSVGYVLVTPLAEELAFRGFVTKWLDRADLHDLSLKTFSWWALVVSSLLFGALHGSRWLPATIAGMSFGLALYRRGSIADAVWAHATTNGMLAIYACATGQWSVWS